MKGYQISFFTQQDRKVKGMTVSEFIIGNANKIGIRGGTVITGSQGFGRDGKIRSVHFFDLVEQPLEITFAVTDDEKEVLYRMLDENGIDIFFIQTPIEFGMSSKRNTEA